MENVRSIIKQVDDALRCLKKAADIKSEMGEPREAADSLMEAGELISEEEPKAAVGLLKKAGDMYKQAAQGSKAGKAY